MEKERKSSVAYLMQLAGKYKLHLLVSALFGIASALCSFIPYVMVYRSILVLLGGGRLVQNDDRRFVQQSDSQSKTLFLSS